MLSKRISQLTRVRAFTRVKATQVSFVPRYFANSYSSSASSESSSSSNPDLFNVNIEDADTADTKNFFKYTWGKWLVNDAKERELRETKFSIKGLADLLNEKVDYLDKSPSTTGNLQIKTIEPFHEGKHHKIYRIDLVDGRSYALRIPYSIGLPEYRAARMRSEVATMDFLKRKHSLTMPSVISWSPTKDNRLGSEYILLDFVSGDLLMKKWQPASTDIQAKSAIIKPAVDFMSQIVSTAFKKYGALYFIEDVPASMQNELPYEGEKNHELIDRYRIGPTVEPRFWKGPSAAFSQQFRGPWTSIEEYMADTANVQVAYAKRLIEDQAANRLGTSVGGNFGATIGVTSVDLKKALETFERYAKVAPLLFSTNADPSLTPELIAPRLHHPDLNPINIIHRTDKSYLLDMENTSLRPFVLHGAPQFVRHKGPSIFKKEDIPDYEKMTDEEKHAVDHFICQTQNQFAFEFLFKDAQPDLINAFNPRLKRLQAIVASALQTSAGTKDYIDLDYDLLRLSREWQYLATDANVKFPIEYTQQQLDEYVSNLDAWNQHVIENPFLETKGWIPIHIFDELLGKGILERQDNGDYKVVAPLNA